LKLEAAVERVARLAREHELDEPLLERVIRAAFAAHDGQKRKDGAPYIVHPLRVAICAAEELGAGETEVVAAALLHDTVEDTEMTLDMVEQLAGPLTRTLVALLTKPKIDDKKELNRVYFSRLEAGDPRASVVKCADRIDNLRDMERSGWSLDKKRAYLAEAREQILPIAAKKAPNAAAVLGRVVEEVASAL